MTTYLILFHRSYKQHRRQSLFPLSEAKPYVLKIEEKRQIQ